MTEHERLLLAAAMDRVLPPDGPGPGATEANAIAYMDWFSATREFQAMAPCCDSGLALLDEMATLTYGRGFLACGSKERDAVLAHAQRVPHPTVQRFFVTLIRLTLAGFLCPPHYGGNRGGVGWRHVGFRPYVTTVGASDVTDGPT